MEDRRQLCAGIPTRRSRFRLALPALSRCLESFETILLLGEKMTPFTNTERREFIDVHVAHRLSALLSVLKRQNVVGSSMAEFWLGKGHPQTLADFVLRIGD
jgi:hypothetical protein